MLTRPVREEVRVTFRDRLKAFEFESSDGGHEHEVFLRKGVEADFNDFRRFSSEKRNRYPAVARFSINLRCRRPVT